MHSPKHNLKTTYMNLVKFTLMFFIGSGVFAWQNSYAQNKNQNCLSCEDVQHAINLIALEKSLMEADNGSLDQLDEEALEWFQTFQKGGLFFTGWQEISENVVGKVPKEKKLATKLTMQALGLKIGCEWSKDNKVRKISTSMLQDWGKKIRKAVKEPPGDLLVVVYSIESEVDQLLLPR